MDSMNPLRRLLREPLFHFLVVGGLAAALFGDRGGAPRRIDIDEGLRRGLRQDFQRRTGAPPTAQEESALLRRWADEEILVREAQALGLDRGDVVVRRRLLQKMEFLAEESRPLPEPDEATLRAHLESHPERWQVAPGVRFTHVFVGRERHGDATLADARALLARLVAGEDPASLGDPFLRGREVGPSSRDEIAAQFGAEFASRVTELPVGTWSGPVGSSYGLHLVRVEQRRPGGPPPLAEVREAVRHDWIEERRAEARRAKLDDLRRHYDLRGVP
jgi:PPIC-type PPIASE domain